LNYDICRSMVSDRSEVLFRRLKITSVNLSMNWSHTSLSVSIKSWSLCPAKDCILDVTLKIYFCSMRSRKNFLQSGFCFKLLNRLSWLLTVWPTDKSYSYVFLVLRVGRCPNQFLTWAYSSELPFLCQEMRISSG